MQNQSVEFETMTDILLGGVKLIIQSQCLYTMKVNSLDGGFLKYWY